MNKILLIVCLLLSFCNLFSQECIDFKAVHTGGNWGTNYSNLTESIPCEFPQEYFEWLTELGANWIGISVSLHVENSLDSIVKNDYETSIPTYRDKALIQTIQKFKEEGFKVYLTLAFEMSEAEQSEFPVSRWQLGDPKMYEEDPNIILENWPWAIEHPNHSQFVESFFKSYTEQAVHFASIAEDEHVDMFSLGTETERLFRTRSSGYWPNDYRLNLQSMVDSVRNVYTGLLTYDMLYRTLIDNEFYGAGSDSLWKDLDLDVIGISAYFELFDTPFNAIPSIDTLDYIWDKIIDEYFIPLKDRNNDLPIVMLEFGYVNDINSPYQPNSSVFQTRTYHDDNANGLDDEEEVQANIYESFFNTITNRGIISGAFLWGNEIASNDQYLSWNDMKHFGIRNKLAESVVRNFYGSVLLDTTICEGNSIQIGDSVFNTTGNYSVILTNQQGCDSIVNLDITVNSVDTSVSVSGNSLTSGALDAEYQWLDCNLDFVSITDANDRSYTATQSGNYAVEVKQNSCIDTSWCHSISISSIIEMNDFGNSLKIFPNPTNGKLMIKFEEIYQRIRLEIQNVSGQKVMSHIYKSTNGFTIDLKGKTGFNIVMKNF